MQDDEDLPPPHLIARDVEPAQQAAPARRGAPPPPPYSATATALPFSTDAIDFKLPTNSVIDDDKKFGTLGLSSLPPVSADLSQKGGSCKLTRKSATAATARTNSRSQGNRDRLDWRRSRRLSTTRPPAAAAAAETPSPGSSLFVDGHHSLRPRSSSRRRFAARPRGVPVGRGRQGRRVDKGHLDEHGDVGQYGR